MKLAPEMIQQLTDIKQHIVQPCDTCSGVGYYVDDDGDEVTCGCMLVYLYIMCLVIARIPREYWHLRLNDLNMPEK